MPTYAQLQTEPVWGAQFAPPALKSLADRLSAHFDVPVWIAGNEDHVYGRHRSRDWCLSSRFCTNRTYGTRDARDKRGDGRWYRAFDLAVKGQPLWDVCRRVDAAVRSGLLPELAEWFGTYDGKTVVGWYEGHPSSSDNSHLTHFHGGVWTESADDPAAMDRLFAVITGASVPPSTEEEDMRPVREPNGSVWIPLGTTDWKTKKFVLRPVANPTVWDRYVDVLGETRQLAAPVDWSLFIDERQATPAPTAAIDEAGVKAALVEALADPAVKAALAQAAATPKLKVTLTGVAEPGK